MTAPAAADTFPATHAPPQGRTLYLDELLPGTVTITEPHEIDGSVRLLHCPQWVRFSEDLLAHGRTVGGYVLEPGIVTVHADRVAIQAINGLAIYLLHDPDDDDTKSKRRSAHLESVVFPGSELWVELVGTAF